MDLDRRYREAAEHIMGLVANGDSEAVDEESDEVLHPLQHEIFAVLDKLVAMNAESLNAGAGAARASGSRARQLSVGLPVVAILLGIAIGSGSSGRSSGRSNVSAGY